MDKLDLVPAGMEDRKANANGKKARSLLLATLRIRFMTFMANL